MREYYRQVLRSMTEGGILYLRDEEAARNFRDAANDMSYSFQRLSGERPTGLSNKIAVMITKPSVSAA